jgi:hypothetical protein
MTSRIDDIEPVAVPVDTSKLGRIVENLLANVARWSSSRTTTGRARESSRSDLRTVPAGPVQLAAVAGYRHRS